MTIELKQMLENKRLIDKVRFGTGENELSQVESLIIFAVLMN